MHAAGADGGEVCGKSGRRRGVRRRGVRWRIDSEACGGAVTCFLVQMATFGGYHALNESEQLQKKSQEEAMADDALLKNLAGMDVNDDAMSIASSNAENELELMRAQVRHLQGQANVMSMTNTTLAQQLAETTAAVSPEQQKHNKIISNPVFVSAISAMQGPDLDVDTLWWLVQWGNEYLAKFKRDASVARKKEHVKYKDWTAHTKQKQMTGFSASLRGASADDSVG
jgi:hypothetical protein